MKFTNKTTILGRLVDYAMLGIAFFMLLIAIAMMTTVGVNKPISFLIMLLAVGLCLPPTQKEINEKTKKNYNPFICLVAAIALFVVGVLVSAPTKEQAKEIEAAQAAQAQAEAQEKAAKEREKADKIAAKEKEKAEKEAAKEREHNTSDVVLITNCQLAIKPNLKNPKSMDVDMGQSRAFPITGGYGVNLYYYAQNGFGAMILNTAQCEFNSDGALLKVNAK